MPRCGLSPCSRHGTRAVRPGRRLRSVQAGPPPRRKPSLMPSRALGPDLAVGAFVLLLGALALWQAAIIPTSPIYAQVGPKAVPFVIGAGLLALGAGLVATALRGGWSWTLEEVQEAP